MGMMRSMILTLALTIFSFAVALKCPYVGENGISVCGEGKCVTKPDVLFAYPDQPKVLCGELEIGGIDGRVPLDAKPILPLVIKDECGCEEGEMEPASVRSGAFSPTKLAMAIGV